MTEVGAVRRTPAEDKPSEPKKASTARVAPPLPRGARLRRAWAVWAPLLARAITLGLTLLGLAAIGLAAGESPNVHRLAERGSTQAAELVEGMGWLRPEPAPSRAERATVPSEPRAVGAKPSESLSIAPQAAPCVAPLRAGEPAQTSGRQALPIGSLAARARPTVSSVGSKSALARSGDRSQRNEGRRVAPLAHSADSGARVPAGAVPRIAINAATAAQLRSLPGIGAKRAAQIVALRSRLGRFSELTDLLRVRGIGVKSLRKLLPRIRLDSVSRRESGHAQLPARSDGNDGTL